MMHAASTAATLRKGCARYCGAARLRGVVYSKPSRMRGRTRKFYSFLINDIIKALLFVADEKSGNDDDIVSYETIPLDSATVRIMSYSNTLAASGCVKSRQVHREMAACRRTLFLALRAYSYFATAASRATTAQPAEV